MTDPNLVARLRATQVPGSLRRADIRRAADYIEELEQGGCRLNCRNVKTTFMAGHKAATLEEYYILETYSAEAALDYKEWKKECGASF